MKSESKSLFVTASGIFFVKSRKRRVAKTDSLTLPFKLNLQLSLKFPLEEKFTSCWLV